MALPLSYPLKPGLFCIWNAEYAAIPSLVHAVSKVLITGLDIREGYDTFICYVVQGDPPVIASCRLDHFRASVSLDPVGGWASAQEIQDVMDVTAESIREAHVPGAYNFV